MPATKKWQCEYIVERLEYIEMHNPTLAHKIDEQGGFVTDEDLPAILLIQSKMPLLVRCGAQRKVVAARDVNIYIAQIEASGDYVRDVSIPCPL